MSTVGDAVDRCLSTWLLGTFSSTLNQVATGIDAFATEINCSLPLTAIGSGAFISIENEMLYIAETDQTNNRLIVLRGQRGTDPAAHITGTTIEVNPRFPRFLIRQMMQADIASWPGSLYNVQHFTGTTTWNTRTIQVPQSINGFVPRGVLKVRRKSLSLMDDRYRRTKGYDVLFDILDDVAGDPVVGVIQLDDNTCINSTCAVQVACDFNVEAVGDDDNDLQDDVGLSGGMQEILELGAAYRLLMGRGSVRLFPEAQGQSRAPQEVGSQDIPRLAEMLLQLKDERMGEEAENLTRRSGFGGS